MTFCNPGEWILAADWTYPSAVSTAQPWGIKFAPVAADGEGLSAVDLRRVLTEWDEVERGGKRFVYCPAPRNHGLTVGSQAPHSLYRPCRPKSYWSRKLIPYPVLWPYP